MPSTNPQPNPKKKNESLLKHRGMWIAPEGEERIDRMSMTTTRTSISSTPKSAVVVLASSRGAVRRRSGSIGSRPDGQEEIALKPYWAISPSRTALRQAKT
jgi:hypothetical protein